MLTEPTRQKLYALQLHGMAEAYEEQNQQSASRELPYAANVFRWSKSPQKFRLVPGCQYLVYERE